MAKFHELESKSIVVDLCKCKAFTEPKMSPVGRTFDGGHLILVEDEESGTVSYKVMSRDGHLGSLED